MPPLTVTQAVEVLWGRIATRRAPYSRPSFGSLGDSLTDYNWSNSNDGMTYLNFNDWFSYGIFLSNSRVDNYGDYSLGGTTIEQIRDTRLPLLLAATKRPDFVVVCAGTNNLNATDVSDSSLAALQYIWETLISNGIIPILCTVSPYSTDSKRGKINRFVASYAYKNKLPFFDFQAAVIDASTGAWAAGYSQDGVHPNLAAGVKSLGQRFSQLINSLVPEASAPFYMLPSDNTDSLIPNPCFTTTGSGGYPANWIAAGPQYASDTSLVPDILQTGNWFKTAKRAANRALNVGSTIQLVPGADYILTARAWADVESVGGCWILQLADLGSGYAINPINVPDFRNNIPKGTLISIPFRVSTSTLSPENAGKVVPVVGVDAATSPEVIVNSAAGAFFALSQLSFRRV